MTITIEQKGADDFRAFAHVQDSKGDWWELRGYGPTAAAAARDAWDAAQSDEEDWELRGYAVQGTLEQVTAAFLDLMRAHGEQAGEGLSDDRRREIRDLYAHLSGK